MPENKARLRRLEIDGFKSIPAAGQSIEFGDVTILLGANGSGKSNLVSFFRMLNFLTTGGLQEFIGRQGGADAILHYGAKHTDKLEFTVHWEHSRGQDSATTTYGAKLVHGMPDRLFFAAERVTYHKAGADRPQELFLDAGAAETALKTETNKTAKVVHRMMSDIRAYQFHDTSDSAKIKANGYIDDCRYLRDDAGNLAAFLRQLRETADWRKHYERIVHHIQRIMPQFHDFSLQPLANNADYLRLNWHDRSNEMLFGPHQISDGSLRFMALTALLLQPVERLPGVIVVDEPELGLHPAALADLAGMIRMAARHAQIILATQSTRLVDEFHADEVVVVERDEATHGSVFRRLRERELGEWLARYSLSELWEKNVLGGLP